MRKSYTLIGIIIVLILSVNIYSFFDNHNAQLKFQTSLLRKQAEICGSEIEKTGSNFENEINFILFSDDISNIFQGAQIDKEEFKKLEIFYSKYQGLVTNIRIFDAEKNVYSLYRNQKEEFIIDYYVSQQQEKLVTRDQILGENGTFRYLLPIFKDKVLYGNIEVTVNLIHYIHAILDNYHIGTTLWQWIIDEKGTVLFNNLSPEVLNIQNLKPFVDSLAEGSESLLKHKVNYGESAQSSLSILYPVRLIGQDLGLVFSLNTEVITKSIISRAVIMLGFSILLLAMVLLIFRQTIVIAQREKNHLKDSENSLRQIIDLLPIGIIILDKQHHIKTINKTAISILNIKKNENLIGQNITSRFLFPEDYLKPELHDNAFDSHHFIYYKKEGHEVVILKKEIPILLGGEENIVEAFIDVTPIENARKQEVAANNAKSEFLAKMSHEIRTPMNGIIGMAEALSRHSLPEEQADQVNTIRKSAELLLSILNDILDYSKIEAGKMIVEDIPFSLREEIKWAVDLYKPIAEEKGLELYADIADEVIDPIIGDPFKLRQILSNLLSNAMKFTSTGKVVIHVKQEESYSGNITLSFAVEDTGIGIPKDKISHIFSSFTQADGTTTRKYGGTGLGTTIAKQLVELLNGEISVQSPSGISNDPKYPGAKFSFTIEVYSNEPIRKKIDISRILNYSQLRALYVTNEPEAESATIESIKNLGIHTDILSSPHDLIEFLRKKAIGNNAYHLLFLMDTPFLNGFNLARVLQEDDLSDAMFIILISNRDKQGNYIRCKQLGINHYLIKPFDFSEIFDFLQSTFIHIKEDHGTLHPATKLRKDISILLAEDNMVNQKVARTIFKTLGYEIKVAGNGEEAVDLVLSGNFDIIFMDVMMPIMDGLQATIDLRKKGFANPIVAMTASASREDRQRALNIGMDDYLTKPVRLDAVKSILFRYFSES